MPLPSASPSFIPLRPPHRAWIVRTFAWLVTAFVSVGLLRGATEIALTIDCAFCGPTQPFPHNCPKAPESVALPAAVAFSGLLDTARKEATRLRALPGMNLPALGDVTSPSELDRALATLIARTEAEIIRAETDRARYLNQRTAIDAENTALNQLAHHLENEIARDRAALTTTENATAAEIRGASAVRDAILALQHVHRNIRQETWQMRNRLFPLLNQASQQGWILPPSSYRPMPSPLPPSTSFAARSALPRSLPSESFAPRLTNVEAPQTASLVLAREMKTDPVRRDVQGKLERLPELWERARNAAAQRDEAMRALESQQSAAAMDAARLSRLQPERAALASQLAHAERNLHIARETHAEYSTRLSAARTTAIHAWIEWGIVQLLAKKASDLLATPPTPPHHTGFLAHWNDIAATAVRLSSDPLGVIKTFPELPLVRGAALEELQRDLAGVREKFGLGSAAANADFPPTALPYLAQERR